MKGTIQKLTLSASLLFALFFSSATVWAQADDRQAPDDSNQTQQERPAQNIRLDEFLDLTNEQRDQIREINRRLQPQIQLANRRVQLSQRALDQAIYADNVDEGLIEQRVRELTNAQIEQARLRSARELQFRKVLGPEQIQKFLTLRQRMIRQQQRLRRQLRRGNQPRRLLQNEEPNQQPVIRPRQNRNNAPIRNPIRQNQ